MERAGMSVLLRFVATIVGVSVFFLLAILGWGGFAPFFSHPALVALAVLSLVIVVFALFAGGNISAGEREDRGNRWVLTAFGVISLAIGFFPAYTDRLGFWTLDGDAIRWAGVIVYVVGCVLRIFPVYVLGNRFSGLVAIQPGHTLVTTSIYGRIRHPSYLGMLVTVVGWALAFRSVVGLLLSSLLLPVLISRMNAEERLLRSQFGAEYDAYVGRTSRLIPNVY
jgi:protein-S-isoprenylcysteine O-methyltransferase Ste14